MAYSSKNTADLAKIGIETFDVIDDIFPRGGNSKPPSAAPPTRTPQQVFHYRYHPQQAYVVVHQQGLYDAPEAFMRTEKVIDCNEAVKMYGGTKFVDYPKRPEVFMRTEKVIDCNEAVKMYGGTKFVDYPKRKPARNGFFF